MTGKRTAKSKKKISDLPAGRTSDRHATKIRGGVRDAASGLPTGKRMHKS
jgi:hypothetical protein